MKKFVPSKITLYSLLTTTTIIIALFTLDKAGVINLKHIFNSIANIIESTLSKKNRLRAGKDGYLDYFSDTRTISPESILSDKYLEELISPNGYHYLYSDLDYNYNYTIAKNLKLFGDTDIKDLQKTNAANKGSTSSNNNTIVPKPPENIPLPVRLDDDNSGPIVKELPDICVVSTIDQAKQLIPVLKTQIASDPTNLEKIQYLSILYFCIKEYKTAALWASKAHDINKTYPAQNAYTTEVLKTYESAKTISNPTEIDIDANSKVDDIISNLTRKNQELNSSLAELGINTSDQSNFSITNITKNFNEVFVLGNDTEISKSYEETMRATYGDDLINELESQDADWRNK